MSKMWVKDVYWFSTHNHDLIKGSQENIKKIEEEEEQEEEEEERWCEFGLIEVILCSLYETLYDTSEG